MSNQKRGGLIQVQVNGVLYDAKGDYKCGFGVPKREAVVGSDRVHGFTEKPQVPYIEGEITDRRDLDLKALFAVEDATVTVEMAVGKVFVLRSAYYAGDGDVSTGEGNVPFRFEGASGEEIS